jgi:5-methyltetrahydrofolate--homocysteine methyltransferase
MRETVDAVRAVESDKPVFVGGAVVTPEWAEQIGAGYSADAPGCVNVVRTAILGKRA